MVFTFGDRNVKCELYDGFFSDKVVVTFYVPNTSQSGAVRVPEEIVRYRLNHDFNIEVGYYSVTNKTERKN
jgi:hypothetical protein